jgi:hypothetical protein
MLFFRTKLNEKSTKKYENEFDDDETNEYDMFANKKHGLSAWRRLHVPAQAAIDLIVGRTQENKDFFGEQNLSTMFRDLDTDNDGLISKVCLPSCLNFLLYARRIFFVFL